MKKKHVSGSVTSLYLQCVLRKALISNSSRGSSQSNYFQTNTQTQVWANQITLIQMQVLWKIKCQKELGQWRQGQLVNLCSSGCVDSFLYTLRRHCMNSWQDTIAQQQTMLHVPSRKLWLAVVINMFMLALSIKHSHLQELKLWGCVGVQVRLVSTAENDTNWNGITLGLNCSISLHFERSQAKQIGHTLYVFAVQHK